MMKQQVHKFPLQDDLGFQEIPVTGLRQILSCIVQREFVDQLVYSLERIRLYCLVEPEAADVKVIPIYMCDTGQGIELPVKAIFLATIIRDHDTDVRHIWRGLARTIS